MLTSCHFTWGGGGRLHMGAFRTIMARTFRVHSSESRQDRFLTFEKYEKRQTGSSVTLKMEDVTWRCELCRVLVRKKTNKKKKLGKRGGWRQRGTKEHFQPQPQHLGHESNFICTG